MGELIGLTLELQLVIVAGYLGYRLSAIGSGGNDRTEDVLFKVLVYGLLGRLVAAAIGWIAVSCMPVLFTLGLPIMLIKASVIISSALALSALWRAWGEGIFADLMNNFGIYQDDHQLSAWRSITSTKRVWDYVQIHLTDGRILESDFQQVSNKIKSKIIANDDGIAVYVTKIIRPDDTEIVFEKPPESSPIVVTFIPQSQISQIDIRWN